VELRSSIILQPLISWEVFFCCSKEDEWFYESFTNIYHSILCHIWEVINQYIHRCEAICLTISVLNLVFKIPAESWRSCGEFILYRYKPKDWNIHYEVVFTGKHHQIFRRNYIPLFQGIWLLRLWRKRANSPQNLR